MKQMKKIAVIFLSAIIVLGCSSCNVNLSVNTDSAPTSSAEKTETPVMPAAEEQSVNTQQNVNTQQQSANAQPNANNSQSVSGTSAFYGVWCCGSKSESDANKFASQLLNQGFDARVFVTTDWTNLNPEKFYVVTAGICSTKVQAEQLLGSVKANGYSNAYIKYTGERK